MTLVSKFGGSSLSSAQQFEKVKKITLENEDRRIVIVSAIGKREASDVKLTDLFYSVYEHMSQSAYYDSLWQEIDHRFLTVKKTLNLTYNIEEKLQQIRQGLAARSLSLDDLVSRGEYLTAKLMAEYLNFTFYDAKDLIIFHQDGTVDFKESYARISTLPTDEKIIIPGFYGASPTGEIKLFSRGGSDITGAIIAAGVNAATYENFTDVPGVLMADPRIVKNPKAIEHLTYDEMQAIAFMGAEVLHRKSVYPVKQKAIPIHIKNTNDPHGSGTFISSFPMAKKPCITGFFGKKNYTFLTLYKERGSSEIGFMRKIFEIFERYHVNIEQSLTGIDQVGILVSAIDIKYCIDSILADLSKELQIATVEIKEDFSLIAIFGRDVIRDAAFLTDVFGGLKEANINPSLIEQSPCGLNLVIGVANHHYDAAICALYESLVRRK